MCNILKWGAAQSETDENVGLSQSKELPMTFGNLNELQESDNDM